MCACVRMCQFDLETDDTAGESATMHVLRREVIKVHQLWKDTEKARAESEAMRERLETHCLRLQSAHDVGDEFQLLSAIFVFCQMG